MALHRDNHICQGCLRFKKITLAEEVHHIKPVKDYPEQALELDNLESLCRDCHEGTRQRRSEATYPARVIKA